MSDKKPEIELAATIKAMVDARVDERLDEVLQHAQPAKVVNFPVEPMVKIDTAAEYLGVTVRHVRQLVAANKVIHYKVGGSLRFKLSELDERTRVPLKAVS
jgi:excisionase family DNA binding protein